MQYLKVKVLSGKRHCVCDNANLNQAIVGLVVGKLVPIGGSLVGPNVGLFAGETLVDMC